MAVLSVKRKTIESSDRDDQSDDDGKEVAPRLKKVRIAKPKSRKGKQNAGDGEVKIYVDLHPKLYSLIVRTTERMMRAWLYKSRSQRRVGYQSHTKRKERTLEMTNMME